MAQGTCKKELQTELPALRAAEDRRPGKYTACLCQQSPCAVMAGHRYHLVCAQKGWQIRLWRDFCISPGILLIVLHIALLLRQRLWFSHLHLTLIYHAEKTFILREEILHLIYLPVNQHLVLF